MGVVYVQERRLWWPVQFKYIAVRAEIHQGLDEGRIIRMNEPLKIANTLSSCVTLQASSFKSGGPILDQQHA